MKELQFECRIGVSVVLSYVLQSLRKIGIDNAPPPPQIESVTRRVVVFFTPSRKMPE
jgi:hypothetical protein